MKIKCKEGLKKIETSYMELESGDNIKIIIPSTSGCPLIQLKINRFGQLEIKAQKRYIKVFY